MLRSLAAATLAVALCAGALPASNAAAAPPDASHTRLAQGPKASGAVQEVAGSDYVRRAALADLFEIEAGKLASERGQREDVRAFGRMMVDDHTAATTTLNEAAKAAGIVPPEKLDQPLVEKLTQLKEAEPHRFDRIYVDMQRKAHEDALALHRTYAQGGDHPGLQAAAAAAVAVAEQHLEKLKALSAALPRRDDPRS